MSERRSLIEGVTTPAADRRREEAFVFGTEPQTPKPAEAQAGPETAKPLASTTVLRIPFTTKMRPDLIDALKRASLERRLAGESPHAIQEMIEAALEPWLTNHGHPAGR